MGKVAMNVGHELLPGVSYPEHLTEDFRVFKFKGLNDFRVAISDYTNVNALMYTKLYIKRLREFFPTSKVIYGVGKKANKFRTSQWLEYKAKLIEAAHYAQDNNLWFQQFNEDDANWSRAAEVIVSATKVGTVITCSSGSVPHGLFVNESVTFSGLGSLMSISASSEQIRSIIDDYTYTFWPVHPGTDGTVTGGSAMPNPSLVKNRHIALAAELTGTEGITVPLIGSIGQGNLSTWSAGGGDLTLALNIYGEGSTLAARLANFKSQVDTFVAIPQPTGTLKMITEYGINASFGAYPPLYADQVSELQQRTDYLEAKPEIDKAFFFCWRSNAWSGAQNDNFAMRLTWSSVFAPYNIRWSEIF